MFGMKIGFGVVRVRKFVVCIFLGDWVFGGGVRSRSGRLVWSIREDVFVVLGIDNVSWLVVIFG